MKKVMCVVVMVMLLMVSNLFALTVTEEKFKILSETWPPASYGQLAVDAQAIINAADSTDLQKAACYRLKGYGLLCSNDSENAKVAFTTNITTYPNENPWEKADCHYMLGGIYQNKDKDYVKAILEYEKALSINLENKNTHVMSLIQMSDCYVAQNNKAKAFESLKIALSYSTSGVASLSQAFKNITTLQSTQVTDWKAYIDWMTSIAVSIPSTSQELTDFAGIVISERDKLKKIYGIQ